MPDAVHPLVIAPSPLLGPVSWAAAAEVLGARVVDTRGITSGPDLVEAVVRTVQQVSDATGGRPPVLVTHSNAGLAAPEVGARVALAATVHVDAALPTRSPTPLAPPPLLDLLRRLADDSGVLPPWTEWWDDLDGVFPDRATRLAVEAEQPRLQLSYFTATLPVPPRWETRPAAYLAFGETYAEEVALARGWGWPVRTMAGRHLHQLHDPAGVAEAVASLAARLTA